VAAKDGVQPALFALPPLVRQPLPLKIPCLDVVRLCPHKQTDKQTNKNLTIHFETSVSMRLINTTSIRLEEFNEAHLPPYAILSHTWGTEEVAFQEIQMDKAPIWKSGYQKIVETCRLAVEDNISYAWVDTCCIDKSSSAELSEAINSMFRWYAKARICYAFLSDVASGTDAADIVKSRWFTRGWTLQELIAPRRLLFYDADWGVVGDRSALGPAIAASTGIGESFLQNDIRDVYLKLSFASIAQRMSWAAKRQTTRTEDLAYCLLGLFGINMPLLYGEGEQAFIRLQEEIIQHTNDHSIFAWGLSGNHWKNTNNRRLQEDTTPRNFLYHHVGMLAPAPGAFVGSEDVVSIETGEDSAPFFLTNRGVQINLRVFKEGSNSIYGILQCRKGHAASLLAIPLTPFPGKVFRRSFARRSKWVLHEEWMELPQTPLYLSTTPVFVEKYQIPFDSFLVKPLTEGMSLSVSQGYAFDPSTHLIVPKEGGEEKCDSQQTLHVRFWRSTESHICEALTLAITLHPLRGIISGYRRFACTYIVEDKCAYRNCVKEAGWFASVVNQKIFGRPVLVIEAHHARLSTSLNILRARMAMRTIRYWFLIKPIDDLTSREIFRYYPIILDFAFVRPTMIIAFAFLTWHPIASQAYWREHTRRIDPFILTILRYGPSDSRVAPLWASLLAWASFVHERNIAPRNARIAGLYFCAHLVAAMALSNTKWILFWALVASSWAFPLGERYYYYQGSVRGYGKFV